VFSLSHYVEISCNLSGLELRSKERASTIETVNAELKTERGLTSFRVRGLPKVRCVALSRVLAYNVMHFGWQMFGLVA
jgi:Transposase DDE domain